MEDGSATDARLLDIVHATVTNSNDLGMMCMVTLRTR
jgi:hypothetical protein